VIAVTVLPKYSFIHFICLITEQAKCSGSAVCNRHRMKILKHSNTRGNILQVTNVMNTKTVIINIETKIKTPASKAKTVKIPS